MTPSNTPQSTSISPFLSILTQGRPVPVPAPAPSPRIPLAHQSTVRDLKRRKRRPTSTTKAASKNKAPRQHAGGRNTEVEGVQLLRSGASHGSTTSLHSVRSQEYSAACADVFSTSAGGAAALSPSLALSTSASGAVSPLLVLSTSGGAAGATSPLLHSPGSPLLHSPGSPLLHSPGSSTSQTSIFVTHTGTPLLDTGATSGTPLLDSGSTSGTPPLDSRSTSGTPLLDSGSTSGTPLLDSRFPLSSRSSSSDGGHPPDEGAATGGQSAADSASKLGTLMVKSLPGGDGVEKKAAVGGDGVEKAPVGGDIKVSHKDLCKAGDDGFSWRRYGHKSLSGGSIRRFYFCCKEKDIQGCSARKVVNRFRGNTFVSYIGTHNHGTHNHGTHNHGARTLGAQTHGIQSNIGKSNIGKSNIGKSNSGEDHCMQTHGTRNRSIQNLSIQNHSIQNHSIQNHSIRNHGSPSNGTQKHGTHNCGKRTRCESTSEGVAAQLSGASISSLVSGEVSLSNTQHSVSVMPSSEEIPWQLSNYDQLCYASKGYPVESQRPLGCSSEDAQTDKNTFADPQHYQPHLPSPRVLKVTDDLVESSAAAGSMEDGLTPWFSPFGSHCLDEALLSMCSGSSPPEHMLSRQTDDLGSGSCDPYMRPGTTTVASDSDQLLMPNFQLQEPQSMGSDSASVTTIDALLTPNSHLDGSQGILRTDSSSPESSLHLDQEAFAHFLDGFDDDVMTWLLTAPDE